MDLRSRDHRNGIATADVREDILLETNFDEDGALTLAHAVNPHTVNVGGREHAYKPTDKNIYPNTENPLLQRSGFNARRSNYRSDTSIDRYSEYSLHGRRDPGLSHTLRHLNHDIGIISVAHKKWHCTKYVFLFA